MPKYFIYGGYVFAPLTRNLLMGTDSTLLQLRTSSGKWAKQDKKEVVILLKVLASKINRGDHNFSLWRVDKVNSKEYKDFKEFVQIVEEFSGEYLILENEDGIKIAIDREKAIDIENEIIKRYSIKSIKRL